MSQPCRDFACEEEDICEEVLYVNLVRVLGCRNFV
jgi:hypothetical protein